MRDKQLEGEVFWDIVENFESNGAPTKAAIQMAHDLMADIPLDLLAQEKPTLSKTTN